MEEKENEILVSVQNVSKKFSLDLRSSLKYGAADILKSTFGIKINKDLRPKEFWAVKDVSFKLRRGECIGLIGHNGAGKSTLLKILNGLYTPDKGQIVMKGKVGALIELGAGFNPILTGRENIYNNASILGFKRKEIEQKIDSIIEFSEIEKFIDMPVQNYSSGMKVRLGFAVAAHLEPDVLIIDEVLAVGDMAFSLKCFKKIDELLSNTAIIFVSHNMTQVSRICNQLILLDYGKIDYQGFDISKGIKNYLSKSNNSVGYQFNNIILNSDNISITEFKFNDSSVNKFNINWSDNLVVSFKFKGNNLQKMPYFALQIFDKEQKPIVATQYSPEIINLENKTYDIRIDLGKIELTSGEYSLNLGVLEEYEKKPIYKINSIANFFVKHDYVSYSPLLKKIAPTIQ